MWRLPTETVAGFLLACALFSSNTSLAQGAGSTSLPDSSAQSPLGKAEALFSKGKQAEALLLFQEILKNTFAPPRELALSNCRVGVIHSIQGKNAEARPFLEKSVALRALPRRQGAVCHYALLQVYALQNANVQARELVKRMGELELPDIYRARAYAVAAEVGARLGDGGFEAIYLQKLLGAFEQNKFASVDVKILNRTYTRVEVAERLGLPTRRPRTVAQAGDDPAGGLSDARRPPAQPAILAAQDARADSPAPAPSTTPPGPTVKEEPRAASSSTETGIVASNGAALSLSTSQKEDRARAVELFQKLGLGQNQDALSLLQSTTGEKPSADFMVHNGLALPTAKIEARLRKLATDSPRDMRVGLIVPSGSSYTRFKHKILRATSAFAGSTAAKDVNFTYKIKPVSNDLGVVEEAVLSLLLDENVHVIIGPLSGTQALGSVSLARAFGVPLFAFGPVTWSSDLDSVSLVRMGVLARSQAEAHVRHLQDDLGFDNAGVLAPNDGYGFEMASAFIAVAKKRNFGLDRITSFDVTKDVFQEPVVTALGPQDAATRRDEFKALEKELRKKAASEKRKYDASDIKLPARVTFDALYVPDTLARAKIIATTFAFNEAKGVRFLGDRTWAETPSRPSLADQFLNGSRTPQLSTGSFLSFLRRDLAVPEGPLDLERQTFDALTLIRQAQYRASGNNGARLVNALHASDFSVEATASYGPVDEKGEPSAKMLLYGYKNGRFSPELERWTKQKSATRSGKSDATDE